MAAPELTEEQIRDAFLVGKHEPVRRPDNAVRIVELEGWKKRAPTDRPLSAKWYMIMTMQLRGMTNKEISARVGCTESTVSNICHTDKYRTALEARMKDLDVDIITLKPKAIDALSNALADPNRDTALRAARTYFEMTGQGTFGKQGDTSGGGVGAVALAKALVAEARSEVHIHVGAAAREAVAVEAAPARSITAQSSPPEAADC